MKSKPYVRVTSPTGPELVVTEETIPSPITAHNCGIPNEGVKSWYFILNKMLVTWDFISRIQL